MYYLYEYVQHCFGVYQEGKDIQDHMFVVRYLNHDTNHHVVGIHPSILRTLQVESRGIAMATRSQIRTDSLGSTANRNNTIRDVVKDVKTANWFGGALRKSAAQTNPTARLAGVKEGIPPEKLPRHSNNAMLPFRCLKTVIAPRPNQHLLCMYTIFPPAHPSPIPRRGGGGSQTLAGFTQPLYPYVPHPLASNGPYYAARSAGIPDS